MHFRYHKMTVIILLLLELFLAANVELERSLNLHMVMAILYFGISFWFIFGDRQWWLYQFAGVFYVAYIIGYRFVVLFEMPFDRVDYHIVLAILWGAVLTLHLFVERQFGPPTAKPVKDRSKRYFPDDED